MSDKFLSETFNRLTLLKGMKIEERQALFDAALDRDPVLPTWMPKPKPKPTPPRKGKGRGTGKGRGPV